jgi:hypothetical protein
VWPFLSPISGTGEENVIETPTGRSSGRKPDRNGRRPLIREENLIETATDRSSGRKT